MKHELQQNVAAGCGMDGRAGEGGCGGERPAIWGILGALARIDWRSSLMGPAQHEGPGAGSLKNS